MVLGGFRARPCASDQGSPGSTEFAVSLALLTLFAAVVVTALLLDSNGPKAMRVGLAAATYVSGLVVWRVSRRGVRSRLSRVPATPFILSGCGAGLVSGVVRPELNVAIVAVQVVGAGFLLGGLHWFAIRVWRRVYGRVMA